MLPEKFSGGKIVVFFIGLSQLFNVGMGANGAIIVHSKYYKFDLYSNLFLLVITFLSNYIFIPETSPLKNLGIYGINGAAFATSLSIFLFNLFKFLFILLKVKIHPFSRKTFYTILLLLFVYFFVDSISLSFNPYLNIILKSSTAMIIFIPITLYSKLSLELITIYQNIKKNCGYCKSVIVTVYNSETTIEKVISRIKNQSGVNIDFELEIIVIDDCSTDKSYSILKANGSQTLQK